MPEIEKSFQRQVAYKVRISDLLNGTITKDEFSAGHIAMNGVNVSRANVIATVVYKSEESGYGGAVIDDGTGKIPLRSFENKEIFSRVGVSDVVLVIGKVRQFNDEKYIIPEVLKKLDDSGWFDVRKIELGKFAPLAQPKILSATDSSSEENIFSFNDEIYSLIKALDTGEGVLVDEVLKNSKNPRAEMIITKLLENGDIFEIKPGKLKVLE